MDNFPKIYNSIWFDEIPNALGGYPAFGIILDIKNEIVTVKTFNWEELINFEVDGSSWSVCGNFKREQWNYNPEIE